MDLLADRFADSRDLLQVLSGLDQGLQTLAHIPDGPGSIAVGPDPKGILPLNVQDVGDFGEDVRDGLVFHFRPPFHD